MGPGPFPPHEVPVPPGQGLPPHQEGSPTHHERRAGSQPPGRLGRSPGRRGALPVASGSRVRGGRPGSQDPCRTRNGYAAPPARTAARAPQSDRSTRRDSHRPPGLRPPGRPITFSYPTGALTLVEVRSRTHYSERAILPPPAEDVLGPVFATSSGVLVLAPLICRHPSEHLLVPVTQEQEDVDDVVLQRASENRESGRVGLRINERRCASQLVREPTDAYSELVVLHVHNIARVKSVEEAVELLASREVVGIRGGLPGWKSP